MRTPDPVVRFRAIADIEEPAGLQLFRTPDYLERGILGQTSHLSDATICLPEDDCRGARKAELGHQGGIVLKLSRHCRGDRFQRGNAAVLVLMFVLGQGLLR